MITQHHITEQLFSELTKMPLWVKLVLYLDLKKEVSQYLSAHTLEHLTEEPLALYTPVLTQAGEMALAESSSNIDALLTDCRIRLNVLDICLRHQWALAELCKMFLTGYELRYIEPPKSNRVYCTIEFIAGRTRLGEYLLKVDLISPEQLDQALRAQKYIEEAMNEHTKLANILINLGYITRRDTETILFLKEESQQPLPPCLFWGAQSER